MPQKREPLVISGRFYTADEAAQELGVSKQRALTYLKEGRLTGVKLGNYWLIAACSVERFLRLKGHGNTAGDIMRDIPGEYDPQQGQEATE